MSARMIALVFVLVALAASSCMGAIAARLPSVKEREAITRALPARVRNTPVECLWLNMRVSNSGDYALVAPVFLNATIPHSRCVRHAFDAFFLLKRARTAWHVVYVASDLPKCSLGIPHDLIGCRA